jgi:hypothetical protein
MALELNRRLASRQWPVIAHAVHSGAVVTKSSTESIKGIFRGIPYLPFLVGRLYFPLLWRSVDGGARVILCAALAQEPMDIVDGGQYLDALCHPFLPVDKQNDWELDQPNDTITLKFGRDKPLTLYKDPIQALKIADMKWSKRLFDVSLELLEHSPAKSLVHLAP